MTDHEHDIYTYKINQQQAQMSNNLSNDWTTSINNTSPYTYQNLWKIDTASTYKITPDYKEIFEKSIVYILGSSKVSQDIKDEFINQEMRLKEFRDYVKEYFPQYIDKITLWEKLHPE